MESTTEGTKTQGWINHGGAETRSAINRTTEAGRHRVGSTTEAPRHGVQSTPRHEDTESSASMRWPYGRSNFVGLTVPATFGESTAETPRHRVGSTTEARRHREFGINALPTLAFRRVTSLAVPATFGESTAETPRHRVGSTTEAR